MRISHFFIINFIFNTNHGPIYYARTFILGWPVLVSTWLRMVLTANTNSGIQRFSQLEILTKYQYLIDIIHSMVMTRSIDVIIDLVHSHV
jgi:hypothetical protein